MQKKEIKFDVDYLLEVDRKRKELMKAIEKLNAIKNTANKRIQLAENEEDKKI
jgi:seryl-tRNA synthetase